MAESSTGAVPKGGGGGAASGYHGPPQQQGTQHRGPPPLRNVVDINQVSPGSFFVRFQKNSRPAKKKLKAHLDLKTQPFGGYFRFYKKFSRNFVSKLRFFMGGHIFLVIFISKNLIFRPKNVISNGFLLHSQ